jgi:hypothetical protein
MASKLMVRKLESRGSGKFGKSAICSSHAINILLLLACGAAVLVLCSMYVDVRTFYDHSSSEESVVLQRGLGTTSMNSHGSEEGTASRPPTEISPEAGNGGPSEAESDDLVEEEKKSEEAVESTEGSNDSAVVVEESHDSGLNDDSVRSSTHPSKDKVSQSEVLEMPVGADSKSGDDRKSLSGCDISQGKWVYDEKYPLYRSRNCPFADPGFRCEENGRPDTDFMKYRWQPRDCDLPRFLSALAKPTQLLELSVKCWYPVCFPLWSPPHPLLYCVLNPLQPLYSQF